MKTVILSIDQGTTSSRTLVFSPQGDILYSAQEEFPQIYPNDGWVEHDPEAIWSTVLSTLKDAYAFAKKSGAKIAGIGNYEPTRDNAGVGAKDRQAAL